MKDGLAVQVAIRLKDLSLVKMLIEPLDVAKPTSPSEDLPHSHNKVEIRRPRSEDDVNRKKSTKKRKLEDRVDVSQAMLQTAVACNARDIVEYFMQEKSCMPDMRTVKLIGTTSGVSGSRKKKQKIRG